MRTIPDLEYVKYKVKRGQKLTALQQFVLHHCPEGENKARIFTKDLGDMVHDIETDQY